MGTPLCRTITYAGGGGFKGKWSMAEPVWCCGVMVDTSNPHWLHPTSILDVYKVFYQLGMLWMGIWVHPYAVIRVQVGVSFRENGVWPSLYDVVVSWLRLQTPIDCIPHPYWMYTKCFSTLRCCGWAYGCIIIAVLHVQVGGILGEMGYGRACMMLWCHGWGFKPPLTASHIHIRCIQSFLAPWDAVDGHMGTSL
jgi:hypothetical protein